MRDFPLRQKYTGVRCSSTGRVVVRHGTGKGFPMSRTAVIILAIIIGIILLVVIVIAVNSLAPGAQPY
jgi:hypothetical protein